MKKQKLHSLVIGTLGGAVFLVLLDAALELFIVQLIGDSKVQLIRGSKLFSPYLYKPFQPSLAWFVTKAALGALLGGVTYSGLMMVRQGYYARAARLLVRGGVLIALLLFMPIGFGAFLFSREMGTSFSALSQGGLVFPNPLFSRPPSLLFYVPPGHSAWADWRNHVPTLLWFIFSSLVFNVPLGWSLLLVATGRKLRSKRCHSTFRASVVCRNSPD